MGLTMDFPTIWGEAATTSNAVGAGTCQISLRNHTAGSLSEAVVLNFVVLRAATA